MCLGVPADFLPAARDFRFFCAFLTAAFLEADFDAAMCSSPTGGKIYSPWHRQIECPASRFIPKCIGPLKGAVDNTAAEKARSGHVP